MPRRRYASRSPASQAHRRMAAWASGVFISWRDAAAAGGEYDALVDEPHGCHQLVHGSILDIGEETGVECDVLLGRSNPCAVMASTSSHRCEFVVPFMARVSGNRDRVEARRVSMIACRTVTVDLVEGGA